MNVKTGKRRGLLGECVTNEHKKATNEKRSNKKTEKFKKYDKPMVYKFLSLGINFCRLGSILFPTEENVVYFAVI